MALQGSTWTAWPGEGGDAPHPRGYMDMALDSGTILEYVEKKGFGLIKEKLYSQRGFKVDIHRGR